MKCKNCEKPTIEHPHMDCKQFTPSKGVYIEAVAPLTREGIKSICEENKGCGKLYFNGKRICGERNLCPSCSNHSPEFKKKVLDKEPLSSSQDKDPDSVNTWCKDKSGSDFKLSDKIEVTNFPKYDVLRVKFVKELILRLKEDENMGERQRDAIDKLSGDLK